MTTLKDLIRDLAVEVARKHLHEDTPFTDWIEDKVSETIEEITVRLIGSDD